MVGLVEGVTGGEASLATVEIVGVINTVEYLDASQKFKPLVLSGVSVSNMS